MTHVRFEIVSEKSIACVVGFGMTGEDAVDWYFLALIGWVSQRSEAINGLQPWWASYEVIEHLPIR